MLRFRWIALLALTLSAGCASSERTPETPLEYAENARRAYEEALEDYYDESWETLVPRMEQVRRKYGSSRYARLAELRIADARFAQDKHPEAIAGYRSFVRDYPNDAEVPYARYRIARAQFASASGTVLLPPLEERDLVSVREAYSSIRSFLRDYPGSKHAQELRYMHAVVEGLLVRHELYVARYYLNEDRFRAAISRIEYALRNHERSDLEPEALVLLGETYLRMKEQDKARAVLERVLSEHPASPFTLPARRFLAMLGEPVARRRMASDGEAAPSASEPESAE
jgi:outer membrane protein assembly factor BamD